LTKAQPHTQGLTTPAPLDFVAPTFHTRAPWWGADLQTLRNVIIGSRAKPQLSAQTRLSFPMSDGTGDVLHAAFTAPLQGGVDGTPLVVLVHGLSGSEDSSYMLMSARFWAERGHRVLRLNLRGAGPSREHCVQQYHAGRTQDLRDVLSGLPVNELANGLILVGYSLGGNMLLKFMAEFGCDFPVVASASVSAPIDLAAASRRFLDARNWVYHQHLLRNMKHECFGGPVAVSDEERAVILSCRTILEFDERIVAPRNGFRDAAHYYHENHARRYLREITSPTLLIHAQNDPWIPADAYTRYPFTDNPQLHPVLTKSGGHVGFHVRNDFETYYDHCIHAFATKVMA
jgi:uncharacterized protein